MENAFKIVDLPIRASVMDVRNARGVYKSWAEVQAALKDGTYEVRKTMYVDKRGKVFYLCFKNGLQG
jgi:hypothetical protein